jgi:hypothetical protein
MTDITQKAVFTHLSPRLAHVKKLLPAAGIVDGKSSADTPILEELPIFNVTLEGTLMSFTEAEVRSHMAYKGLELPFRGSRNGTLQNHW